MPNNNRKNVYYSILLDIYGNLLTKKQYHCINRYYNLDLSLAEIAEEDNISRQAVRDNIKKAEEKLDFFEKEIQKYSVFLKKEKILNSLEESLIKLSKLNISENVGKTNKLIENIQKNVNSLKKI